MFFRMPKGRNAPLDLSFDPRRPDAVSLHDRKLVAWASAIGASVPLAYPATDRRPHRGDLADVDMSLAGPDPGARPRLWRRVIRRLGRLRAGSAAQADTAVSGAERGAIGVQPQMPYIGGKPVA